MNANPLLAFAMVLASGIAAGELAARVRLPKVTGWICAGIALRALGAPWLSHLSPHNVFGGFVDFALGYIAFVVGSALRISSLRNAHKRLALLTLSEAVVTPLVVAFSLMWLCGFGWQLAWLLAAIAIAGAPGTTLTVLHDSRARGVFTRTLVGALPLIDLVSLGLFAVIAQVVQLEQFPDRPLTEALVLATKSLGMAVGIGTASAALPIMLATRLSSPSSEGPGFVLTIMLAWGLAQHFEVSGIMACTLAGVVLANSHATSALAGERYLAPFAAVLFTTFYVLAGTRLDFRQLSEAAGLVALYFGARFMGKLVASYLAMALSGTITSARRYLGLALVPHGGVAIGLILVVQESPGLAEYADAVTTVALSALALNQLVGPSMTRLAIARVGEAGLDRSRLLDFLAEQNILVGLTGASKREVIGNLLERLPANRDDTPQPDTLCQRILDAEDERDTCLGSGLMIPHTFEGQSGTIRGVLGLSSKGLDLGANDGRPIHAVLLLVIPESERHHHLEILAALATLVGSRPEIRERLYHATTPAHAHKLLNPVDEVTFNRFEPIG